MWDRRQGRTTGCPPERVMFQLSWEQFTLRRGEELVRRLVTTPTLPLPAAARHYLGANLYAAQLERPIGSPKAGGPSRVDPLFGIGVPGSWASRAGADAGGRRCRMAAAGGNGIKSNGGQSRPS